MKILSLAVLCLSTLIFTGCTSFGTKYSPDKEHEVYYKGSGVEESHAKKLFDYLKEHQYFNAGHPATVQIDKTKDTFNVNFVYDKTMVDADRISKFIDFGAGIDKAVFGSAPMTIHLCDENMKMFKDVGYIKPAGE